MSAEDVQTRTIADVISELINKHKDDPHLKDFVEDVRTRTIANIVSELISKCMNEPHLRDFVGAVTNSTIKYAELELLRACGEVEAEAKLLKQNGPTYKFTVIDLVSTEYFYHLSARYRGAEIHSYVARKKVTLENIREEVRNVPQLNRCVEIYARQQPASWKTNPVAWITSEYSNGDVWDLYTLNLNKFN